MRNAPVITLTLLAFLSTVGCAEVGNFFIPPHPKSDYGDPSKACLYLSLEPKGKKVEFAPLVALAASTALGLLVDRTAAAIKDESKRYQSSYSARQTADLITLKDATSAELNWDTLRFVRYLGKDVTKTECKDLQSDEKVEKAVELVAKLQGQPTEIKIETLRLNKTQAKVASIRWFVPWSWWMVFDRSSQKIDLKATVVMSAIVQSDKGNQLKDIISADLPLGKRNLNDEIQSDQIKDISSGPFILPSPGCTPPCEGLKTTVTVTLTESNELGDVIGDASKKVADNKQSIINFVLEQLKIETPKKDK